MNATPSLLVDFRGNAIPPQVVDSKQIQLEKFPDGSTVLRLKCGGADLCTPVLAVNTKETFQSLAEVPAVVGRGDKPAQQQGNEDDGEGENGPQEDEDSSSPVEAVEEGNDEGEEGKEAPPQPRPKRNMRRQESKESEEGQEGGNEEGKE
eukprot:PhF_6_TR41642/c1_g1_i3/m.63117